MPSKTTTTSDERTKNPSEVEESCQSHSSTMLPEATLVCNGSTAQEVPDVASADWQVISNDHRTGNTSGSSNGSITPNTPQTFHGESSSPCRGDQIADCLDTGNTSSGGTNEVRNLRGPQKIILRRLWVLLSQHGLREKSLMTPLAHPREVQLLLLMLQMTTNKGSHKCIAQ